MDRTEAGGMDRDTANNSHLAVFPTRFRNRIYNFGHTSNVWIGFALFKFLGILYFLCVGCWHLFSWLWLDVVFATAVLQWTFRTDGVLCMFAQTNIYDHSWVVESRKNIGQIQSLATLGVIKCHGTVVVTPQPHHPSFAAAMHKYTVVRLLMMLLLLLYVCNIVPECTLFERKTHELPHQHPKKHLYGVAVCSFMYVFYCIFSLASTFGKCMCVCVLDVVFHFERMHAKRVVAGRETAAAAAVHNKTVRDFVPTHSILIYYCHEILYRIRVFDASGACTNALVDHVHVCVCLWARLVFRVAIHCVAHAHTTRTISLCRIRALLMPLQPSTSSIPLTHTLATHCDPYDIYRSVQISKSRATPNNKCVFLLFGTIFIAESLVANGAAAAAVFANAQGIVFMLLYYLH